MMWRVDTDLGTVEVWAESPAQARSRAKYKAVNARYYGSKAEMAMRIRECQVYDCKELKEDGQI